MIDQTTKDKWIKALRSGDYKQTRGKLSTSHGKGFCCLGVLADVIDPDAWRPEDVTCRQWRDHAGLLPGAVLDIATQSTLATKNDQFRSNFAEIANWVEENVHVQRHTTQRRKATHE